MLSYQYGPTLIKNAFSTLLSQLKAKGGQTQYYVVVANNILGECTFILLEEDVFLVSDEVAQYQALSIITCCLYYRLLASKTVQAVAVFNHNPCWITELDP